MAGLGGISEWILYSGQGQSGEQFRMPVRDLVTVGKWFYLTVVVDRVAGLYRCYVNGTLTDSRAISHPAITDSRLLST